MELVSHIKKYISVYTLIFCACCIWLRIVYFGTGMFGVKHNPFLSDGAKLLVIGTVVSEPEDKDMYWKYVFQIDDIIQEEQLTQNVREYSSRENRIPIHTKTYILVREKKFQRETVEYGQKIKAHIHIKKPQDIQSEDGRVFGYKKFLEKDGIFYIGDLTYIDLVQESKKTIRGLLFFVKQEFIKRIEQVLPAPHSFLATGLVISGKGSMSKELQQQFQKVGLIHIVVLSGSNISIIGEAIYKMFFFLPVVLRTISAGVSIVLFGVMTGGGATVVRSVIMALIGLYSKLTERKNNALKSLMIAAFFMIMHNPNIVLYDPSFQLSFLATLGLISISSPLELIIKKTFSYVPESAISLTSTTLATQFFTAPLILRFTGMVSLVALPVNLLVLPLIPSTMLFVFLTGVFSFMIPIVRFIPAFVSWFLLSIELHIVKYASGLYFSSIIFPPISDTHIAVLVLLIILCTFALKQYAYRRENRPNHVVYKTNTTPV